MKNLTIELENHPGSLAQMGQCLGTAGVSIEGGGAWVVDGKGIANFLFEDGAAASDALTAVGIRVVRQSDVVLQKLNQDQPGQLGKLLRRMAEAGVNVEVQYSDHQNQLVLVVDDVDRARAVSGAWTQEQASHHAPAKPTGKSHRYAVNMEWTGNRGTGTSHYSAYLRDHAITVDGKAPILGSSDPAFRGSKTRHNPEEFFVAALSSCHMLSYLHLCAVRGVVVLAYTDAATGTMLEGSDGSGRFTAVTLHPVVTISHSSMHDLALALHEDAHRLCFIANSVNFPVGIEPQIIVSESV